MKFKLSLVFVALFASLVGFVFFKFAIQGADRTKVQNEGYVKSILLSQVQQIQIELRFIDQMIDRFEKLGASNDFLGSYHGFAKLQLRGTHLEVLNSKFDSLKISTYEIEDKIKDLLSKTNETKQIQFFMFKDADKKQHLVIFYPRREGSYLVFSSTGLLQSFVDLQKNLFQEFMVINQEGDVLAHTQVEYVGTRALEHPLYKVIQNLKNQDHELEYSHRQGTRWGTFDSVFNTNLYLIATAPLELMKGNSNSFMDQLMVMALGILFLGLGLVVTLSGASDKEKIKNQKQLIQLQAKLRQVENEKKDSQKINLTPQEKDHEKLDAYGRIAAALAFEIRSPLTAILAYSQSLLNHVKEVETIQWTESILKEARQVRSVLDKMFVYAGITEKQKTQTKIEGVILKVLKELEPLFKEKGVHVHKEFKSKTPFSLNMESMERVFRNLLLNAVEAMERMPKKELSILVEDQNDLVHVIVEDTGEGIESDKKENIFDPFFTTRAHQKHLGLGLTIVGALLKEQNSEIEIQSERSKGTRVEIKFHTQDQSLPSPLSIPESISKSEPEKPPDEQESIISKPQEVLKLDIKPVEGLMAMDVDKLFELSELPEEGEASFVEDSSEERLNLESFNSPEPLATSAQSVSVDDKTAVVELNTEVKTLMRLSPNGFAMPDPDMVARKSIVDAIPFSVQIRKPGKG